MHLVRKIVRMKNVFKLAQIFEYLNFSNFQKIASFVFSIFLIFDLSKFLQSLSFAKTVVYSGSLR